MSFVSSFFFVHFWFNLVEVFFSVYFTLVFFSSFFFFFILITVIFFHVVFWRATMIMIMNASYMHIMLSNRFRRKKRSDKWIGMESKYRLNFQKWWVCYFFFLSYFFYFKWRDATTKDDERNTKAARNPNEALCRHAHFLTHLKFHGMNRKKKYTREWDTEKKTQMKFFL